MKNDSEIIARAKEKIARKLVAIEWKRVKREVQQEIAKSLQEDAISVASREEIYKNFDAWLRNEKEKERTAKRKS